MNLLKLPRMIALIGAILSTIGAIYSETWLAVGASAAFFVFFDAQLIAGTKRLTPKWPGPEDDSRRIRPWRDHRAA